MSKIIIQEQRRLISVLPLMLSSLLALCAIALLEYKPHANSHLKISALTTHLSLFRHSDDRAFFKKATRSNKTRITRFSQWERIQDSDVSISTDTFVQVFQSVANKVYFKNHIAPHRPLEYAASPRAPPTFSRV